jgi:hypothetical protein
MVRMSRLIVVVALFALVASFAHGAVVAYNETTDGDLPFIGSPLPTFTFDVGANTVSGTEGYPTASFVDTDSDSFAFVIPAGYSMTGGTLQLTDNVGDPLSASWNLYSGSADYLGGTFQANLLSLSPGSISISALPAGTYHIDSDAFASASVPPSTANYVFTFNIVPEPASLAILGLSSLALLVRPRRS